MLWCFNWMFHPNEEDMPLWVIWTNDGSSETKIYVGTNSPTHKERKQL